MPSHHNRSSPPPTPAFAVPASPLCPLPTRPSLLLSLASPRRFVFLSRLSTSLLLLAALRARPDLVPPPRPLVLTLLPGLALQVYLAGRGRGVRREAADPPSSKAQAQSGKRPGAGRRPVALREETHRAKHREGNRPPASDRRPADATEQFNPARGWSPGLRYALWLASARHTSSSSATVKRSPGS